MARLRRAKIDISLRDVGHERRLARRANPPELLCVFARSALRRSRPMRKQRQLPRHLRAVCELSRLLDAQSPGCDRAFNDARILAASPSL